jgi:hypothetical protein
MLGARLFFLPVCLLHVVILFEGSSAGAAEGKAVVAGASTANLRAEAGKATLKEGEQASVETFEGEWYQVTASDGQTELIHKSFLKVGSEGPKVAQKAAKNGVEKLTRESISMAAAAPQSGVNKAPTTQRPTTKAPPAAAAPEEPPAGAGKSPSILQMLEGHENEIMIAAAVAAAFFFVGWICGGNYYLRRDRKRRNKIRF